MHLRRRDLLRFALLVVASEASAAAEPQGASERFDILDCKLAGDADLSRRAVVLVPRGLAPDERVPVLVLLHGLGETSSETAGTRAWIDRYGLLTSHARLLHPPVAAETKRGDLLPERARQINDELGARPFDGRFVIVCPYTPNVSRLPSPPRALDRFAAWMADVLLPEVRKRTPADARAGLDGCSMGGFIGLEVFLRRPELFSAWGGVQSALGEAGAPRWADRIAEALQKPGRSTSTSRRAAAIRFTPRTSPCRASSSREACPTSSRFCPDRTTSRGCAKRVPSRCFCGTIGRCKADDGAFGDVGMVGALFSRGLPSRAPSGRPRARRLAWR